MNSATISAGSGLLLWALTVVLFWRSLGLRWRIPRVLLWSGYIAAFPISFALRGLLGEISVALPALTACACGLVQLSGNGRRVLGVVIAFALCLYISALGLASFDLYGLGYFPTWEMAPVAVLLILAYRHLPILAWPWLCGMGLYASGLLPSPNLWDALIDLPSVIVAAYLVVRHRKNQSLG